MNEEVATIVVTDIQEQRRQQVCVWELMCDAVCGGSVISNAV